MTHDTNAHSQAEFAPLNPVQAWLTRIFATSFGFGYSPFAPGTAGTLPALVLFALWPVGTEWWFLPAAVVIFFAGVPLASWAERLWKRTDPGHVSIDEIVGYMVTIAFVPTTYPVLVAVIGFFTFRFFDIVKPPPARKLEYLPGGWGIMVDDIVAGIYGNILLQITFRVFLY